MSRPPTQGPYVGGLLRVAWQVIRARINEAVHAAGYTDVTHAQLTLFRWPSMDGMRPTELADEVWLSKQALNDLLRDLEALGYLRREVDPDDRRSRIIRLTAKGRRLWEEALEAARQAERDLEKRLGVERLAAFRDTLTEVVRSEDGGERARDAGERAGGPAVRRQQRRGARQQSR